MTVSSPRKRRRVLHWNKTSRIELNAKFTLQNSPQFSSSFWLWIHFLISQIFQNKFCWNLHSIEHNYKRSTFCLMSISLSKRIYDENIVCFKNKYSNMWLELESTTNGKECIKSFDACNLLNETIQRLSTWNIEECSQREFISMASFEMVAHILCTGHGLC